MQGMGTDMKKMTSVLVACFLLWNGMSGISGAEATAPGDGDSGGCDCMSAGEMTGAYLAGVGTGALFGGGIGAGLVWLDCRNSSDNQCGLLGAIVGAALVPYFAARGIHWAADGDGTMNPRTSTISWAYAAFLLDLLIIPLAAYTLGDRGNDYVVPVAILASFPIVSSAGGLYGYATSTEPACCGSAEGGISVIAPRLAVMPVKTPEFSERMYVLRVAQYYF